MITVLYGKIRSNIGVIFITIVFCAGLLCPLENRFLALALTAALAVFVAVRVVSGRVTLSFVHIPLALLPLIYLLASFAGGGATFYSIGQVFLMCVPLLASLCLSDTRRLLYIIAIGVCFFGLLSLLGPVIPFIPNTFTPAGFHSDQRLRLQTLLGYANTGAAFFGCGIFALLGIHFDKYRIIKYLAISLLAACMILTGSRLAIALVLVLLLLYALHLRNAKKAVFVVVCLVAFSIVTVIIVKPELVLGSSLAMRLIYWSDAAGAFFGSPAFGLGPEGFIFKLYENQSAIYEVKFVHSAFLQASVDAGLLALISLLAVSIIALKRAWRENKTVFFMLLLLLLHCAVDIDLSFFPALMLLGLCFSTPAVSEYKGIKKAIVCAALLPVIAISLHISIGERIYSIGVKADRYGKFDEAKDAYQSSLLWMPEDFRSSIRLAGVYILEHEQEKAIELLLSTDSENFNKASRSELLVIAYKNLGLYPQWNTETLALLKLAPFKQTAYSERAEYLLASYYSSLLSGDEYENEHSLLLATLDESNNSINGLARFLLEKDRSLTLK